MGNLKLYSFVLATEDYKVTITRRDQLRLLIYKPSTVICEKAV